ncbi:chemotaxis-specific protein-glutamate methyltransferase CheB [Telmatospirillum sp. J64-1]|uniref:chemotaxis-specific protein-glutamate methyltransferase CheB n=1 Tax=Telmatospirillum sp. J64-1 TaxID=2502183 RepID=UPI002102E2FB|nr:chemotaxis-specific protein-glutamate methyltransferase CheB [Telmatospirillum sp. J64-1]
MKPIRVMIVEDSTVVRTLLAHIISDDPRLEVAAAVGSAEEALAILDRVAPDVVSLDIRLPGMSGIDATLEIMAHRPTPIVVVAADIHAPDLNIAMQALRAGALTVVEKPVGLGNRAYGTIAKRLCDQLVLMSRVKVVHQIRGRRLTAEPIVHQPCPDDGCEVVAIAASTGGPQAVVQILDGLGKDFSRPILLVQHMLGGFLEAFTQWLNEVTPLRVQMGANGDKLVPGVVYVAPADVHLTLVEDYIRLESSPPWGAHRPSADLMFRSVAHSKGPHALGVQLTGMGDDGSRGLLELRQAGGWTIAEDESTAVVFGMPQAACRLGAAREVLPLPDIAPRIRQLTVGEGRKRK